MSQPNFEIKETLRSYRVSLEQNIIGIEVYVPRNTALKVTRMGVSTHLQSV